MYKWYFYGADNNGKRFAFKVTASTKAEAIARGFKQLSKADCYRTASRWTCELIRG